jgi:23S rRNA (guanosine2251-2'-O)-methyltransferase
MNSLRVFDVTRKSILLFLSSYEIVFYMKQKKNHRQKVKKGQKNRMQASLFGTHAVCEALLNPARKIKMLYVTEQAMDQIAEKGIKSSAPTTIIDKRELDNALPRDTVHQGMALECEPLDEVNVQDLIAAASLKEKSVLVMLDQVTDPHNVGAIMRSACAFGADGIIMQKKHAPELSGTLAKIACGAIEHIAVAYETNLTRTLETLQDAGFFAVGLDERGECDINQFKTPEKCVLVLGAEGPGLRRLVKEQCDSLVRLPMSGNMPSINVSNAAAITLYATSK